LIARTIHLLSPRREAGFVPINCASIPETLLESELFGHERGAFTGAVQSRRGKFELAQGGTIFLDEIGEMPFSLQAKLLRVLQERSFERVGGSREIRADVRVIAATNRNLETEVKEGRFREDLFYRLHVFPLRLPPLRERSDAIPELAAFFAERFAGRAGKRNLVISAGTMDALAQYPWPGNIRELQNVLERAVILCRDRIEPRDLPESLSRADHEVNASGGTLRDREKEAIIVALKNNRGNRRRAAEELGLSRRTLQYRLKEYGLIDEDRRT